MPYIDASRPTRLTRSDAGEPLTLQRVEELQPGVRLVHLAKQRDRVE